MRKTPKDKNPWHFTCKQAPQTTLRKVGIGSVTTKANHFGFLLVKLHVFDRSLEGVKKTLSCSTTEVSDSKKLIPNTHLPISGERIKVQDKKHFNLFIASISACIRL